MSPRHADPDSYKAHRDFLFPSAAEAEEEKEEGEKVKEEKKEKITRSSLSSLTHRPTHVPHSIQSDDNG